MSSDDEELIARSNARVGALLKGKYTLERVLGIGGMATVYAATHRNGKEFAIKMLHAELSMRSETRTRFLREGYLANRVNHPGAVAVLDDDVAEDGGAFLVMELLHGQTVEEIWENARGRLPLELVAGVALQLLDVLTAAHARGLVHRDIKPGNLMLTHDGYVKVLDFGIARLKDMASARTTQTGMVMGTPAFMAPEHALAKTEEIDAQTDLWAVGATMFTLATGRLVHDAENTQQLLVKAATVAARPFKNVLPSASPAMCEVVDRALSFHKSERWPNAVAMQTALREAARQSFPKVPTPEVLSEMLDELGQHEPTNILGPAAPPAPVDDHAAPSDPSEFETGRRPALRTGAAERAELSTDEQPAPPPAIGLITAEAVATDSTLRKVPVKTRGPMIAAMAIAVLGIGGLLVVATGSGSPSATGSAASAEPPPASAASARTAPSGAATSTAAQAWTAVAVPALPPSVALAPLATKPAPAGTPPAPRPHPIAPTTAPPPPASAPAAAPAGKASCNPPYEFDADGNKRWKRECL